MLTTVVREFRAAPLGTSSACLGIISFFSATALASTHAAGQGHDNLAGNLALGLFVVIATLVALAVLSTKFIERRTGAWSLVVILCSVLGGAVVALSSEQLVYVGLPIGDDTAGQRIGYWLVAGLAGWLAFCAMVFERYYAERKVIYETALAEWTAKSPIFGEPVETETKVGGLSEGALMGLLLFLAPALGFASLLFSYVALYPIVTR